MIRWEPDTCGCIFDIEEWPPTRVIVLRSHAPHADPDPVKVFKNAARDNIESPARIWKRPDGTDMTALEIATLKNTLKGMYNIV